MLLSVLRSSRYSDVGEGLPGEGQMTLDILADDGLLVVAGNIVPLNTVSVEVIEDGHAGLRLSSLLDLLPVVRLGLGRGEASSAGPVVEGGPAVSGGQASLVGGPEPAVDVLGEEVRSVTSIEVTETAGGPEVRDIGIDEPLHPLVLLSCLEGDQVHAPLSAVVPGIEPVPLGILHAVVVVLPAEPVKVAIKPLYSALVNSVLTKKTVRKAKFSCSFIFISATIVWKEFIVSSCLW